MITKIYPGHPGHPVFPLEHVLCCALCLNLNTLTSLFVDVSGISPGMELCGESLFKSLFKYLDEIRHWALGFEVFDKIFGVVK